MTKRAVEGIGWDEKAYIMAMSDETAQEMLEMLTDNLFTLSEVADGVRGEA